MTDDFFPEVIAQAALPTGGDNAVSTFAMRLILGMEDPPVLRGLTALIDQVVKERPMGPSHLFNLVLRGIQRQALRDRPDDYPRRASPRRKDSVTIWDELIHDIIGAGESGEWEELRDDVMTRQPVSNEERRLVGPSLLERLLGPPAIAIEGGCSQNLIGKAMSISWPIGGIAVSAGLGDKRPPRKSAHLSAVVTELVDARSSVLRIGVDINNIDDPRTLEWFAASPYPGELLNRRKMQARRYLQELVLPDAQLQFYQLDLTDAAQTEGFLQQLREVERQQGMPDNDARNVYLITSAYEAPEMIEAAKLLAGPKGVVAIQDFVEIDPSDPTKVRFLPHWPEWGYRLIALQMEHAERGWQHVMTGRTSRLRAIALGDGKLVVDGEPRTMTDLVARASARLRGT